MRIPQPAKKADAFGWITTIFLVAILAFGAFHFYNSYRRRCLTPPDSVRTFDDFLAWRPSTDRFCSTTIEGTEYVEAIGPRAGLLASGPCRFTFDKQGRLVFFTVESGDDAVWFQRWSGSNRRSITREEAVEFAQPEPEAR